MEHKLMSEQEKVEIFRKSLKLREEGKLEEASAMQRTAPLPAYLAKVFRDKVGPEYLLKSGWNLAEAEAEFGPNWLK